MFNVQFGTLLVNSGETSTFDFYSPVMKADVALKRFSGNNVSCQLVGISGGQVRVTASSDTNEPVEVLIIAVTD
ncbi:MAG: hypothetical protein QNJ42_25340 [Crocosphaera sp.]|nr:hypothetical protein [Crocosphaera sp.]